MEKAQTRKCGDETKRRLLETSLKLLWKSSYGNVSVDDICREANVKKGSFYHFFSSKSELIVAALDEQWRCNQSYYNEVFSSLKPPLERFREYCKSSVLKQQQKNDEYGRVCGCPFGTLGSELCGSDEAVTQKAAEMIKKTLQYFESSILEAQSRGELEGYNAKEKAEDLYSYMAGTLTQARIQNSLLPLERLERGFMGMLGSAPTVN